MTVQAGRRQIAGGFVGRGSVARESLSPRTRARSLSAFVPRTTPARLRAGLIAIMLLGCCLAAALSAVATGVQANLQSMGQQTDPEVNAATGLYLSLTDMDSQVANALLIGGGDTALASDRAQDLALYSSDRTTADADLQRAALTAAGSPAAQQELRSVLDGAGRYEALVADALLADQERRQAGPAPAAVLVYYRQATDLMQTRILPEVAALTVRNESGLNSAYVAAESGAGTGLAVAAGLGLTLIAALAAFQVYLTLRFRRRVSPPLVAATLLAIVAAGFAWGTFGAERSHLRVARYSAFDSIIALSSARALSYNANADESRYLVDPARGAEYQREFLAESQDLASVGTATIASYHTALDGDVAAYQAVNGGKVVFGGAMGAEFRNFTFPGERQAAVRALLAWQAYENDDHTMRTLAGRGMTAAVTYDSGTRPDQSDGSFNQFAAALSAVIAVNQRAFASAVAAGEREAGRDSLQSVLPVMVLALAGLAYLGVRPRLAEYRVRG